MKIKNFLVLLTSIMSILCSSSFAKSVHSLSLEASRVSVDQELGELGDATFLGSEDKIIPTIGYGYNAQFNQFFIKPSVFYSFGDIEIQDIDGTNDSSTFSPSLSVEFDFGYDVNSKASLFATLGFAYAEFERDDSIFTDEAGSTIGTIVGVGAAYNVNENISLTARYQVGYYEFGVESSVSGISIPDFEVETDSFRVGLSYAL